MSMYRRGSWDSHSSSRKRITALRYEDLPPEAVHWAKVGILDTVGVTLAGRRRSLARRIVAGVLSSGGPSLILGTRKRVGALDAALVNGTASHALDFDDCNNTLGGHPSAPILPALFALADEIGASGRDFITAYVAGFETECKISMGVNFYQYTHGWHPTTTIGVFGAAAACAKLLEARRRAHGRSRSRSPRRSRPASSRTSAPT